MVTKKIPSMFWGIEKDTWYRKIFLLLRYQRFFQRFFAQRFFFKDFLVLKIFLQRFIWHVLVCFVRDFLQRFFVQRFFFKDFLWKHLFGRNWNLRVIGTNTAQYVARNGIIILHPVNPTYGQQQFIQWGELRSTAQW